LLATYNVLYLGDKIFQPILFTDTFQGSVIVRIC